MQALCVFAISCIAYCQAADLEASGSETRATTQDLTASASSLSPLTEKHQEKRYVGYGGYGSGLDAYGSGYGYGSRLGLGKLANGILMLHFAKHLQI